MRAKELMDKDFVYLNCDDSVVEVSKVMEEIRRFTCPVVNDNKQLVGWITSFDITRGLRDIGDSITDVEPLEFAYKNNGVSISFNGNEYPLKVAEIAIVSPSAVATAVIADVYANNDKSKVLEFIDDYNNLDDYEKLFKDYDINSKIEDKFFSVFERDEYPIIKIITDENFDEILKVSKDMRNNIRGQDIGGLG